MIQKLAWTALAASLLILPALALGEEASDQQARGVEIYDTKADAKALVSSALARAKKENQRVLVMYGGNWCGWCHKLHQLFEKNPEIARTLLYEYRLVMVDIGRFNKNMEIAASYGADLKKNGVPYLTVLAADGKVVTNQDTGALEGGDTHDPVKVKAFLSKWAAPQEDAEKVMKDGLARAASEKKMVFLHFGAPWCGFCRKLEEFLDQKHDLLDADYTDLKIDIDRMAKGKEVAQKFMAGAPSGIPWIAILDAEGKKLADGNGPRGNIGYPVEPYEIDHFIAMLKETAKKITAEKLDQIRRDLEERAQEIKKAAAHPAVKA